MLLSKSRKQKLVSQAASPGCAREYEFGDNVTSKISCGKEMEEFSVVCQGILQLMGKIFIPPVRA